MKKYLKNTILGLSTLTLLSSNLLALNLCNVKNVNINKTPDNIKWLKTKDKIGDIEFYKYEKVLPKEKCYVYTDKKTKKITKIKRSIETKYPTRPPVILDNAKFKLGELMYIKEGTKEPVKFQTKDIKEYYEYLNKFRYQLRFYKATYLDNIKIATIFSTCKKPGEECKTVFNEKDINLDKRAFKNQSDRLINSIVEKQKLKLIGTQPIR